MDNPFESPTSVLRHASRSGMESPPTAALFALSDASPETVRRTLEAHYAEIHKRLELVSKLGDSLRKQKKELGERLKEVEAEVDGNEKDGDGDSVLDSSLKEKLIELEKEYNEVGRESARAFLSNKPLGAVGHTVAGSQSGTFSTAGSGSPSKMTVPSRRARNQAARQHDIEFAAEIGQGLLVEVRRLQALLSEREETLKTVEREKMKLEQSLVTLSAKVKSLEESDTQMREINWNLEVLVQDLKTSEAEAKATVDKLNAQVNHLTREKDQVIKELDNLKTQQSRSTEESETLIRHQETELATLRRNLQAKENEAAGLSKAVESLKQELEESQKASLRLRLQTEGNQRSQLEPRDALDLQNSGRATPDHSPAPSPIKQTPRHTMLESETLKSSLQHAHRMITNLKSTVHREKTEKAELRRLLQEARDEVEQARAGMLPPPPVEKRRKSNAYKKPPKPMGGLLPVGRRPTQEIIHVDDEEWEDDPRAKTPSLYGGSVRGGKGGSVRGQPSFENVQEESTDLTSEAFETANETEAFETANDEERETTETEAYRSGAEDSDDLTETEGKSVAGTIRGSTGTIRGSTSRLSKRSLPSSEFGAIRSRHSIVPDTSDEEADSSNEWRRYEGEESEDLQTEDEVVRRVPSQQKFRVRPQRSGRGRLGHRVSSNGSLFNTAFERSDSPVGRDIPPASPLSGARLSAVGSNEGAPVQGKSLFAELGELGSDDDEEEEEEEEEAAEPKTPVQSKSIPVYIDCGVMTEVPYPDAPEIIPETPKTPISTSAIGTDPILEIRTPKRSYVEASTAVLPELMTPKRETVEIGTAPLPELMSPKKDTAEAGTAPLAELMTPKRNYAEAGNGPLAELMTPKKETVETGTGPLSELMTPKRVMTSVGTERPVEFATPKRVTASVGTERPAEFATPKRTFAESSTEPASELRTPRRSMAEIATDPIGELQTPKRFTTAAGTQFSPRALFVQNSDDKPLDKVCVMVDSSTQFDPELEKQLTAPTAVVAAVAQSVAQNESVEPATAEKQSNKLSTSPIHSANASRDVTSRPSQLEGSAVVQPASEGNTPKKVSETLDDAASASLRPVTPSPQPERTSGFLGGLFAWNKRRGSEAAQERPGSATGSGFEQPRLEMPVPGKMVDSSAQTTLSSDDFDRIEPKQSAAIVSSSANLAPSVASPIRPRSPRSPGNVRNRPSQDSVRRPGSSANGYNVYSPTSPARPTSSRSTSHPPLPTDHKQAIQRHVSQESGPATPGAMGPPLTPASASRANQLRPVTPVKGLSPYPEESTESQAGTTPRAKNGLASRGDGVYSSLSHRTSMSSFESELETRFNVEDGTPVRQYQPGEQQTDPKMIQAITQTMIGEYLWKYTRTAGRGSMSQNRHRRFFWIHPYTRTLYWSDRDPATAGRAELKAKSVSIEAVRVITDDNPMPPGLYRKSLVIITPGRSLKFTAPTGQRHETWFNALSYLLLRSSTDEEDRMSNAGDYDAREFNPGYPRNSLRAPSLSSYNSRTTRNSGASPSRAQSSLSHQRPRPMQYQGSMSRLSSMFRPGSTLGFTTFSSRASRRDASIYDASEVNDSAEDVASSENGHHHHHHHHDGDGLENVRACCDGKHDVGTLSRKKGRRGPGTNSWRVSKEHHAR